MTQFSQQIFQQLEQFSPYMNLIIEIDTPSFKLQKGNVAAFVAEIHQTIEILGNLQQPELTAHFAHQLVNQFNSLQQAVEKQKKIANQTPVFKSSYRFPKNIHNLPKEKRLVEYKKVLRALNEKISWLMEQSYRCENEADKQAYLGLIEETEFRKKKCLSEIEKLE
ncbi:hypothetical protein A1D22_10800 [Pasteurellaceae bacterium LFhippo2]|nr:hypothetical protein [Pasteurellaceae bacterium LFhippo2]